MRLRAHVTRVRFFLPVAAVLYVLLPTGARAQASPDPFDSPQMLPSQAVGIRWEPSVAVIGEAVVFRAADEVEILVRASAQARTAEAAQTRLGGDLKRARDALRVNGVADRSVHVTGISLLPVYDASGTASGVVRGYDASNVIVVTAPSERVGPLVDAVVESGMRLEGIYFRLVDDSAAKRLAFREALADARAKASAMASGGGFHLGEVLDVAETVAPLPDGDTEWSILGGEEPAPVLPAVRTPFAPGEIAVRVRVAVRFAIAPLGEDPARTGGATGSAR